MARISNGNALTTALLQPGWTFENNGYGLITVKARWAIDEASAFSDGNIGIGATFSEVSGETLKCTKSTFAFQKNGLADCNPMLPCACAPMRTQWHRCAIKRSEFLTHKRC